MYKYKDKGLSLEFPLKEFLVEFVSIPFEGREVDRDIILKHLKEFDKKQESSISYDGKKILATSLIDVVIKYLYKYATEGDPNTFLNVLLNGCSLEEAKEVVQDLKKFINEHKDKI